LKNDLDAAGISPAFDHNKVFTRFYRRSECKVIDNHGKG